MTYKPIKSAKQCLTLQPAMEQAGAAPFHQILQPAIFITMRLSKQNKGHCYETFKIIHVHVEQLHVFCKR